MRGIGRLAAAAAMLASFGAGAFAQCALCREAVESGAGEGLLGGLLWSYLLLSLPAFLLPGMIAFGILRARRGARDGTTDSSTSIRRPGFPPRFPRG